MNYMTIEQLMSSASVFSTPNVPYLPLPNTVDVIISDLVAPDELNPTAFLLAFDEDGNLILADDVKRNRIEVPGGHIDPEDRAVTNRYAIAAANGAIREGGEEAAIAIEEIQPLGIFRSNTQGPKPESQRHPYPHPVSTQQFFMGIAKGIDLSLLKKEDSHGPVLLAPQDAEVKLQAKEFVLYKHALATLFPELAVEYGFVAAPPHP
jgi:hypothetical protein